MLVEGHSPLPLDDVLAGAEPASVDQEIGQVTATPDEAEARVTEYLDLGHLAAPGVGDIAARAIRAHHAISIVCTHFKSTREP
jgi:hypothetical protein